MLIAEVTTYIYWIVFMEKRWSTQISLFDTLTDALGSAPFCWTQRQSKFKFRSLSLVLCLPQVCPTACLACLGSPHFSFSQDSTALLPLLGQFSTPSFSSNSEEGPKSLFNGRLTFSVCCTLQPPVIAAAFRQKTDGEPARFSRAVRLSMAAYCMCPTLLPILHVREGWRCQTRNKARRHMICLGSLWSSCSSPDPDPAALSPGLRRQMVTATWNVRITL